MSTPHTLDCKTAPPPQNWEDPLQETGKAGRLAAPTMKSGAVLPVVGSPVIWGDGHYGRPRLSTSGRAVLSVTDARRALPRDPHRCSARDPKTLDSTGRAGSYVLKRSTHGTSLGVQQLRLLAPNAAGPGSIPEEGTRFLHATTIKRKRSLIIPMPE